MNKDKTRVVCSLRIKPGLLAWARRKKLNMREIVESEIVRLKTEGKK